jgi:hypothetical protein
LLPPSSAAAPPKAPASRSSLPEKWQARHPQRPAFIAKRMECVRLAGAFGWKGAWSANKREQAPALQTLRESWSRQSSLERSLRSEELLKQTIVKQFPDVQHQRFQGKDEGKPERTPNASRDSGRASSMNDPFSRCLLGCLLFVFGRFLRLFCGQRRSRTSRDKKAPAFPN